MRKTIIEALAVAFLLLAVPQSANAQSLKNDSIAYNAKSVVTQYLLGLVSGDIKKMLSCDIDYVKGDAEMKARMEEAFKEFAPRFRDATFTVSDPKYVGKDLLTHEVGGDGRYSEYIDVVINLSNGKKMTLPLTFLDGTGNGTSSLVHKQSTTNINNSFSCI